MEIFSLKFLHHNIITQRQTRDVFHRMLHIYINRARIVFVGSSESGWLTFSYIWLTFCFSVSTILSSGSTKYLLYLVISVLFNYIADRDLTEKKYTGSKNYAATIRYTHWKKWTLKLISEVQISYYKTAKENHRTIL